MIDLAVIPARAGSKRVPNKNTRLLCGKPLIQWTVEAVEQSQYIRDYVITTDIPFVLDTYEKAIKRPEWLCGDDVPMSEVIKDVLLRTQYYNFMHMCEDESLDDNCFLWLKYRLFRIVLLQPTSPLRTEEDIYNAYQLESRKNEGKLWTGNARVPLVSVSETTAEKRMYNADSTPMGKQTAYDKDKDKTCYQRNSAIFIFNALRFIETNQIIHDKPILYKMPQSRSIDIDTEEDWMMAEALMKTKLAKT
jgi:CMP-N,N'-diacetyllegionaminic acid synthase